MGIETKEALAIFLGSKEVQQEREPTELEAKVSELFLAFKLPVYRYLLGLLGNRDDAEEMTQDVFLSLYGTVQKGTRIDNVRAWIFRVAHNLALNHQKRPRIVETVNEEEWWKLSQERSDPAHDSEQRLLRKEKRTRVLKAMKCLSPQERHCLDLRAEGLCFREIAEVLGIRISTVETFLDRGIRKIAKEIND
jgi:RNA polymerase sigma-70 factor (ECF subfamily)